MSLEPITKKDIANLFNKILRSQIKRQEMECVHPSDIENKKLKGENNAEYEL